MKHYPEPISKLLLEKILNPKNKSLFCRIREKGNKFNIGLFYFIKFQGKNVPILIINTHLKKDEMKDSIEIIIIE